MSGSKRGGSTRQASNRIESRAGHGSSVVGHVGGRDGGVMSSMKSWMLGAAILAGAATFASVPAQAAQFGVYVGVHDRYYVPPSPGPGYYWTAGYYSDGYWVPGRWGFRGDRER